MFNDAWKSTDRIAGLTAKIGVLCSEYYFGHARCTEADLHVRTPYGDEHFLVAEYSDNTGKLTDGCFWVVQLCLVWHLGRVPMPCGPAIQWLGWLLNGRLLATHVFFFLSAISMLSKLGHSKATWGKTRETAF